MPPGVYIRTKTRSAESRAKTAEANRRRGPLSDETKAKIAAKRQGVGAGFYVARGYRYLTGQQGHPLASWRGVVAEHRKVLYDRIGPGPHLCHWRCGKLLNWGKNLHADHIDGVKTNNTPKNLVPTCQPCNTRRGVAGNPIDWKASKENG